MLSKFNSSAISVKVLLVFSIRRFADSNFLSLTYSVMVLPVLLLNTLHRVERFVLKIRLYNIKTAAEKSVAVAFCNESSSAVVYCNALNGC